MRPRTRSRDNYVSVLIDGHSHPFHKDFFDTDRDGSILGAKRLKNAVARFLPHVVADPGTCAIDIRFYAAFATLNRFNYASLDADSTRTLEMFTSSFDAVTGADGYRFRAISCFVDESVEYGIEEAYHNAIQDPHCQHILLAAWGKPPYLPMLTEVGRIALKVTLVEGKSMQTGAGIRKLQVASAVTIFDDVFRPSFGRDDVAIESAARKLMDPLERGPRVPIGLGDAMNRASTFQVPFRPKAKIQEPKEAAGANQQKLPHRPKSKAHKPLENEPVVVSSTYQPPLTRSKARAPKPPEDGLGDVSPLHQQPGNKIVVVSPLCQLPFTGKTGHVPVNKSGDRLDVFMERPYAIDFRAYKRHVKRTGKIPCLRLCNSQLCDKDCSFDHGKATKRVKRAARWMAKIIPCERGAQCRVISCIYGHMCQSTLCLKDDEESASCKLRKSHNTDAVFTEWVRGHKKTRILSEKEQSV